MEVSSPTKRVNQACDACKRRKVRCNGKRKCQECNHFDLPCIYSEARRGRPRKGAASRGSVIEECRKSLKHASRSSRRISNAQLKSLDLASATQIPSVQAVLNPPPTTTHLDAGFFLNLIPEYVVSVYPVNPVITEDEIRQCVKGLHTNREAASFLYAFAAVTINLTRNDSVQSDPDIKHQIATLLDRCFNQIDPMRLGSGASLFKIMRNVFVQICLMGLSKTSLGFFYLREAIAMLQMLGVGGKDSSYAATAPEKCQLDRAYWECFVHERFTALSDYKPTCLRPLPKLPDNDPTLNPGIQLGWNSIIKTFLLVDDPFISYWVSDRTLIPAEWFEQKHQELDDDQWEIEVHLLNAMQQADLIITRQWLRTLTWQMALSNILLSSNPRSESLSLTLPLRLSRQLRQFLSKLTIEAVGIHGSGILHKLFDITTTIADVVIQLPYASRQDILNRAGDVLFLQKFLFSFPRIQSEQKEALVERIEQMRQKYPEIEELEVP